MRMTLLVISPDTGEAKCFVSHEFFNSIVECNDDGKDEHDSQGGQLNWHVPDHAETLGHGMSSVVVLPCPHKTGSWLHVDRSLLWFLSHGAILRLGCMEGAAVRHNGESRATYGSRGKGGSP